MSIEILKCSNCQRATRPPAAKAADHPGTIVRGTRELCLTCYKATRPSAPAMPADGPRVKAMPYDVVFASVPQARDHQQSDCRIGCCKNPFMCAQAYRCGCHWRSQ